MNKCRIAIIDDEVEIRESLSELIKESLEVETSLFSSVDEFLEDLDLMFDLIISDVHMPTGSGLRLNPEFEERGIDIPIIFMSGMADFIPKKDNIRILRKPLVIDDLLKTVANSLK